MLSTMVSQKQDSFSLRASFSLCVEGENLIMAQQTHHAFSKWSFLIVKHPECQVICEHHLH